MSKEGNELSISKDLVAASSIPLILSIIERDDDYGYSIIKKVLKLSDFRIRWTDGMLYPVLHRLEKQKLIESYWKESETGRKRKYYHITAQGRTELRQHKNQWNVVHSTLMKSWDREEG